jgi:hypothetical protein
MFFLAIKEHMITKIYINSVDKLWIIMWKKCGKIKKYVCVY